VPEIALPKVVSDDSHTRDAIGRAWIELDCAPERDAILRAIKAGDAKLVYHSVLQESGWK
jgi:hypothetical protein